METHPLYLVAVACPLSPDPDQATRHFWSRSLPPTKRFALSMPLCASIRIDRSGHSTTSRMTRYRTAWPPPPVPKSEPRSRWFSTPIWFPTPSTESPHAGPSIHPSSVGLGQCRGGAMHGCWRLVPFTWHWPTCPTIIPCERGRQTGAHNMAEEAKGGPLMSQSDPDEPRPNPEPTPALHSSAVVVSDDLLRRLIERKSRIFPEPLAPVKTA